MIRGIAVLFAAAMVVLSTSLHADDVAGQNVCAMNEVGWMKVVENAQVTGLIRTRSGLMVVVNDRLWASASPETRRAIALASFCQVADIKGRGFLSIRSYYNICKPVAEVNDGKYSDLY